MAFQKLIPINFLINLFELKNKSFDEKEFDIDKDFLKSFNSTDNRFWFIHYLNTKGNFK